MSAILNRKLEMPSSYAVMDSEEMEYVEGGSISVTMNTSFLVQQNCINGANFLLAIGAVRGMNYLQIAQELYAHAVAYYCSGELKKMGLDNGVVNYLIARGGVADIEDGGDVWYRQVAYACIWGWGGGAA